MVMMMSGMMIAMAIIFIQIKRGGMDNNHGHVNNHNNFDDNYGHGDNSNNDHLHIYAE